MESKGSVLTVLFLVKCHDVAGARSVAHRRVMESLIRDDHRALSFWRDVHVLAGRVVHCDGCGNMHLDQRCTSCGLSVCDC